MKTQPKKAAEPPEKSETTPNYGRPAEKEAREKLDPEFHHGGRTETPDKDVNPADQLHVKEKDVSPTPENAKMTRRHPPTREVKSQRPPRKS